MGQYDVYDYMLKSPHVWFTIKELSNTFCTPSTNVSRWLRQLLKTNNVVVRTSIKRVGCNSWKLYEYRVNAPEGCGGVTFVK